LISSVFGNLALATRYSHQVQVQQPVHLHSTRGIVAASVLLVWGLMSGLAMSHDSRAHSACLSVHLGAARRLFDRALSPLDMVQEEADSQRGTFTFFHPGLPAIDIPSRPSHPKSPRVVTICDHARHAERPGLCTFKGSAHVKAFGKQFASWHLHRQTHVAVQIM